MNSDLGLETRSVAAQESHLAPLAEWYLRTLPFSLDPPASLYQLFQEMKMQSF